MPVAAQASPGSFSLPTPTPTPTPAPQGPADERSGVIIPPRPIPDPQATPTPIPVPTPTLTPPQAPPPRALAPLPTSTPAPAQTPGPAPTDAPIGEAGTPPDDPATPAPDPQAVLPGFGDRLAVPPEATFPDTALDDSSTALGPSVLPGGWLLASLVAAVLALLVALLARRRRSAKPLRLAAHAKPSAEPASADTPPRIDLQLDITGATRSMMMFSLEFRVELANRADKAVRDLRVITRIGYPGHSPALTLLPESAEDTSTIERIGPQQSRSAAVTLRLPLSAIVPLRQGHAPLLIPLLNVTLEGEGRQAETYTFVVGTPSTANLGRLQPIPLDTPPGSIAGLRAQLVQVPDAIKAR
jgi:hypothetical protein